MPPQGIGPRERGSLAASRAGRWRWVTVAPSGDAAGEGETLWLPAVEARQFDEAWLENLPQAVPADTLNALRRAGHRVRHRRELVPFTLDDGRRLLVPVDELDVHYADYQ